MASLPVRRDDTSLSPPSEFYYVQPHSLYSDWLSWLRRRWVPATCVAATTMLCVIAALWLMSPQYRATALVMIQPRRGEVVKIDPVLSPLPADEETVTSELNVIKSRDLVLRLVEKLRLDTYPEFDPNVPPAWKQAVRHAVEQVQDWLPRFIAAPMASLLAYEPVEGEARIDAAVEAVSSRLEVSVMGNHSRVIGITFISADRKLPNMVANTLADLYIQNQYEMKRRASNEANRWISGDLDKLKQDAAAASQRVADFRVANGLIEGRDSSLIRQQISDLDNKLTAATVQRAALAAKLDNIGLPNSNSLVLSSPLIQELRKQQAALATRNAELSYYMADKNPRLQANDAQMSNIGRRIADETQKIVNGLRGDYKAAVDHETALQRQLKALKQEFARVQAAEVTLKQLEEEEQADRQLYANFLNRAKETGRADFELPDALLISHAAPPLAPFLPKKRMILTFGFLLSLLAGSLTAAAFEKFDGSFRSQGQLERTIGVPVLGVVPEFPRTAYPSSKLNTLSLVGAVMTDIYMRLKLDSWNCILIASAVPQEGKTTAGLLLARIAAINGKRVLFVDADLRRSGLRPRLPARKGLSDILTGNAEIAEATLDETQFGIDVITCGSAAENPSGLLASEAMRQFISYVREAYDLAIIDTPAIMAGPDAVILSRLADEAVLFVRWARTPRTVVTAALRRLHEGGARDVAAILSRIDIRQIGRFSPTDAMSYRREMRRYYPAPT